jgi:hypothetical protein
MAKENRVKREESKHRGHRDDTEKRELINFLLGVLLGALGVLIVLL